MPAPPNTGRSPSACGLLDRSERGKLALTGADAKGFLQGQVSNDVEALIPGHGCYAAFLTPKGKMLGDLRILDAGEEILLDTERNALQELFNMIRRFSIGFDVELHKRTLERGLLSLDRPRGPPPSPASQALPQPSTPTSRSRSAGSPTRAIRTDVGVDLLCDCGGHRVAAGGARGVGRGGRVRAASRRCGSSAGARATAIDLDETRNPAGGRAQRARGLVHEGLLRRAGDGCAPLLPR